MTTLVNRMMLLAGSAVAAGSMAYGQSAMKADIPFAFQVGRTAMPSGSYTVIEHSNGGSVILTLRNGESKRAVISVPEPRNVYETGKPALKFICGDVCALRAIRTGQGSFAYPALHNKASAEETAVLVPLNSRNGL